MEEEEEDSWPSMASSSVETPCFFSKHVQQSQSAGCCGSAACCCCFSVTEAAFPSLPLHPLVVKSRGGDLGRKGLGDFSFFSLFSFDLDRDLLLRDPELRSLREREPDCRRLRPERERDL